MAMLNNQRVEVYEIGYTPSNGMMFTNDAQTWLVNGFYGSGFTTF